MNPLHLALRHGRAAVVLASAVLLAGCSAAALPATETPAASATSGRPSGFASQAPTLVTVPPSAEPVLGEAPAAIVAAARADLAGRIGSEAARAAVVVRSEAVTWPDGSLGCPQPGRYYEQIEVEGYQVVFELDAARYDYRATVGGNVLACEQGGPRP